MHGMFVSKKGDFERTVFKSLSFFMQYKVKADFQSVLNLRNPHYSKLLIVQALFIWTKNIA
ncbi:hypothetical protein DB891_04625 [Flavobacterium laiguense]|uniref:Uncharacterized protein n=1 Tax=Flavobacterium laiguense TaxID=2169409 RepID=A0A2U1JZ65_9FLAO|nr:hypothetical protein DB891_04625 [Flavobacterium laiguense]